MCQRMQWYMAYSPGVMSAIAAARERCGSIAIEPCLYVGGILAGGLSHTDYGDRAVVGSLAVDFYRDVAKYYNKDFSFSVPAMVFAAD